MDQESAFQRIWQAFRAAKVLDAEQRAPEDSSTPFAKVIVRVPFADLSPDFETCARELANLGFVELLPVDQLSITLQELGYLVHLPVAANEISQTRLEEFATAAAAPISQQQPFEVCLVGAGSFQDAAFLQVFDDDQCSKAHARLFELAAIPRSPDFPFVPVATIARYTGAAPTYHVVDVLSRWRSTEFVRFPVTNVELVLERRGSAGTTTETFAIIPFGNQ